LTTVESRKATNDPRMHAIRMSRLRVAGDRCSILAKREEVAVSDYQVVKLEDVDDWLGDYPGEMRGITYAIGAEQVAITHRRMPQHTGSKGSYGHRHKTQEEIVLVLRGKLQFKLNDEIVELGPYEAIRIPPQTWRGIWNDEPEDAEIVIVSKRIDDPTGDVENIQDFWNE
jgi:quercetin dioxygenase-like cupin family protein